MSAVTELPDKCQLRATGHAREKLSSERACQSLTVTLPD